MYFVKYKKMEAPKNQVVCHHVTAGVAWSPESSEAPGRLFQMWDLRPHAQSELQFWKGTLSDSYAHSTLRIIGQYLVIRVVKVGIWMC